MKQKEYVYVGETLPEITEREQPEFWKQLQWGVLASLKKRGLLTPEQYRDCMEEIERTGKTCNLTESIYFSD